MECHLCQRVARALHPSGGLRVPKYYDTLNRRSVNSGSWEELKERKNCPTCSSVADFFKNEMKNNESDSAAVEYQFRLWDSCLGDYISLRLQSRDQSSLLDLHICALANGYSNRVGVVMDPYWVDMKQVLEWIKCCDTTHGKCYCRGIQSRELCTCEHMYLIDLSGDSLVEARGGEKYVALSYVWGDRQQPFRTSMADLTLLKSKGGLSSIKERLPGTVQRAVGFTSMLGLNLLWVDILCIVLDGPVRQFDDMAAIYSNSYLTVCAGDGLDSNSSLRGIPECSQPRILKQNVLTFINGAMTSSWVMNIRREASVYHGRAWTFPEQMLSRRTLSFTDHGLEWGFQELIQKKSVPMPDNP